MKFSFGIFFNLAFVSIIKTLTAQAPDVCPANVLSCSANTGGSCCSPTYGLVVLAQQWIRDLGPSNAFTMHGLWPDYCNGAYTGRRGCDASRNYRNVEGILQRNQTLYGEMKKYWASYKSGRRADDIFWTHEWKVHGTCVTTLNPECYADYQQHQELYDYFSTALQLREQFNLYAMLEHAGIVPREESYLKTDLESAIHQALGVTPQLTCRGANLNEIRIHFYVENGNQYVQTDSEPFVTMDNTYDCDDELYYLPK